jgi:iron complex transport system substrate-binding protein
MILRGATKLLLPLLLLAGVTACGSDRGGDEPAAVDAEAATDDDGESAAFPVTIEHKYGSVTIDEAPERVVSVGYTDQDTLLALGVVPVGIRDWFGDQPSATWPWATEALGGAEPLVLDSSEINFEAIAGLRPDLIVGVSSGMTEEEHSTLSDIAPTLPQTDEFPDYGVPWQDGTRLTARALGKADEAEALIAAVESRYAEFRAANPELAGLEGIVAYAVSETEVGAYASIDTRARFLGDLGFVTPAEFDELAGGLFYTSFSNEEIGRLDRDLVVWMPDDEATRERILSSPLRDGLRAVAEGREVFLDDLQVGAMSFSSALSLPFLLDTLLPQIEAAADGDPLTLVGSS